MTVSPDSRQLIQLLQDLKEEEVKALVYKRLKSGENPLDIMNDCRQGVQKVGLLYEQRKYYLSGLIMAGEILQDVVKIIQPAIKDNVSGNVSGRIVIGSAHGDIHDIGKDILVMLLTCHGYSVHDLGVDVPPETFLTESREVRPDVIGISFLLTTAIKSVKETIGLLRTGLSAVEPAPAIIIGGGQLDERICKQVGADAWMTDAVEGIKFCQANIPA